MYSLAVAFAAPKEHRYHGRVVHISPRGVERTTHSSFSATWSVPRRARRPGACDALISVSNPSQPGLPSDNETAQPAGMRAAFPKVGISPVVGWQRSRFVARYFSERPLASGPTAITAGLAILRPMTAPDSCPIVINRPAKDLPRRAAIGAQKNREVTALGLQTRFDSAAATKRRSAVKNTGQSAVSYKQFSGRVRRARFSADLSGRVPTFKLACAVRFGEQRTFAITLRVGRCIRCTGCRAGISAPQG